MVALPETLVIYTAQVCPGVKILARVVIMNDNLAVGAYGAGVTALSAASAEGIPVITPLEPFFQNTNTRHIRSPLRQKFTGRFVLTLSDNLLYNIYYTQYRENINPQFSQNCRMIIKRRF